MIKHIVMWSFSNKADAEKAKDLLEALPDKISEIRDYEAGLNISPRPAAKDLVLYSSFDSADDLASYAAHPEHVKVADFIRAHAEETSVVDYEIKPL
ncbi:MAG: Dabb family protein [Fibrobacterota bacterium]